MNANVTTVSLKEAAALADTDRNYLLKLIKQGKLAAAKETNDRGVPAWRVVVDSLNAYIANKGKSFRATRKDGRRKLILYANEAELNALTQLIKDREMGARIELPKHTARTKVEAPVSEAAEAAPEPKGKGKGKGKAKAPKAEPVNVAEAVAEL